MKSIYKTALLTAVFIICNANRIAAEILDINPDVLLSKLVSAKWGKDNARLPSPKIHIQYEDDLGERWIVDFGSGEVTLECLWANDIATDNPDVINAMYSAVSNVYNSVPVLPNMMLENQMKKGEVPGQAATYEETEYTVRKGDTLSEISEKMRVPLKLIMRANNLKNPHLIRIGQVLIIPPAPPHMHVTGETHERAEESILYGQLTNAESGQRINSQNVGEFGRYIVNSQGIEVQTITGDDGQQRKLTRVKLSLDDNHLEVRARRYYPMIKKNAERFGHDPAVIMALIHTESAFNPYASSAANAYGLMQVVPSSGGREAYKWLHRKDIKPSPAYLLKPNQNLELGNAYIRILKDNTFAEVKNPESRLYCTVAAYNGGGVNVGYAFTGQKSVQVSIATINTKSPEEVRWQLENRAPNKETREYVKQVLDRVALYRTPQWQ